MAKYPVDAIDKKILSHLIQNARMPFLEIARECGISGAAIHQRVKKLEEAGIITGSRLEVEPKALGYDVCAFIGIQLAQPNMHDTAIEALLAIPEVVECHFITGKYTLFIKLYCHNNEHLMHILIGQIQKVQGVAQTETYMSLDQPFERQVYVKESGEDE